MTEPIVVHATPTVPQVAAGIRQVALATGAILSTLGLTAWAGKLDLVVNMATPIASVAVVVGPMVMAAAAWLGQLATRRHAQKAAAMAKQLPNDVAGTK